MRINFFLWVLCSIFLACSDESIIVPSSIENNLANRQSSNSETYLGATFEYSENGDFTTYVNGQIVMLGEKLSENIFRLTNKTNDVLDVNVITSENTENYIFQAKLPEDDQFSNISSFSSFFKSNPSSISVNSAAVNPCDQHPVEESFEDCFAREWQAFCEDLVSCIAQATNPIPVGLAIGIHCATC